MTRRQEIRNLIQGEVGGSTMDLIDELIKLERQDAKPMFIEIPVREEDCHEILNGRVFDWRFEGIDIRIGAIEDEDEETYQEHLATV